MKNKNILFYKATYNLESKKSSPLNVYISLKTGNEMALK